MNATQVKVEFNADLTKIRGGRPTIFVDPFQFLTESTLRLPRSDNGMWQFATDQACETAAWCDLIPTSMRTSKK